MIKCRDCGCSNNDNSSKCYNCGSILNEIIKPVNYRKKMMIRNVIIYAILICLSMVMFIVNKDWFVFAIGSVIAFTIFNFVMGSKKEQTVSKYRSVRSATLIGNGASTYVTKTKSDIGSVVGRSVVGGAVFGTAGAIIGGSTAKTSSHTTEIQSNERIFLVEYFDGTHGEESADIGSVRYNYLMSKLQ